MIIFNHSGTLGDILYSLYFCKELTEELNEKMHFHIQTNIPVNFLNTGWNHPYKNVRMPTKNAQLLESLFKYQNYINEFSYGDEVPNVENLINLDDYRKLNINGDAGDIRGYYYNLTPIHLKREFWKPILSVQKNNKYQNKIILISTERYQNILINYKHLEQFKDLFVFMGTKHEHELFCQKYFNVEYDQFIDFKDAAEKMCGAIGVIGNLSGLYSLAECLKCNRILVSSEVIKKLDNKIMFGPHNVIPISGWCEDASTNEKMIASIMKLLENYERNK